MKKVELKTSEQGILYLDYEVLFPSYSESEFETVKDAIRDILGDLITEFYTEETGHLWKVYIKGYPSEMQMFLLKQDLKCFVSSKM
jgi:hypothetical protein